MQRKNSFLSLSPSRIGLTRRRRVCPIGTNTCIKLLISPVEAVGLKREEGLYLQVKLEQDKKKRREYGLAGKKRNGDFYQTYDWA